MVAVTVTWDGAVVMLVCGRHRLSTFPCRPDQRIVRRCLDTILATPRSPWKWCRIPSMSGDHKTYYLAVGTIDEQGHGRCVPKGNCKQIRTSWVWKIWPRTTHSTRYLILLYVYTAVDKQYCIWDLSTIISHQIHLTLKLCTGEQRPSKFSEGPSGNIY